MNERQSSHPGRPPRSSPRRSSPSNGPSPGRSKPVTSPPTCTLPPTESTSSPGMALLHRNSELTTSSQSLVPYDERHLHDCEHTPRRDRGAPDVGMNMGRIQDMDASSSSCAAGTPAASALAGDGAALQVPPLPAPDNRGTASKIRSRTATQSNGINKQSNYEAASNVPAPMVGHRRRRVSSSTEHEQRPPPPHPRHNNPYSAHFHDHHQQPSSSRRKRPLRHRSSATSSAANATNWNHGGSTAAAAAAAAAAHPASVDPSNLGPVLHALCRALRLALLSQCHALLSFGKRQTARTITTKWVRRGLLCVGVLPSTLLLLLGLASYGFYRETTALCTPPPPPPEFLAPNDHHRMDSQDSQHSQNEPPLVEYYVHGRGNGHYARSVAIIEQLNDAGVDVRMFIGRATMWRAVHEVGVGGGATKRGREEDGGTEEGTEGAEEAEGGEGGEGESLSEDDGEEGEEGGEDGEDGEDESGNHEQEHRRRRRGITTAVSVTSITPSMGAIDTLSHILERITNDCEVAVRKSRYPTLVVTDGDIPGMLRAWFGSVPSVGISHGQTFAIGKKPPFVKFNPQLHAAWERQRSLNWRAAFLTNWQIGTSFAAMDVRKPTGVIAKSPMRPEAVRMAQERWRRRHLGTAAGVVGNQKNSNRTESADEYAPKDDALANDKRQRFLTPEQQKQINALLIGKGKSSKITPRKLVICYFRDKNGDVLQNALLRSGFDVLLFERGYHKGLMNIEGVEKFGHQYIIRRDETEEKELADLSREEYWRTMLSRTNAKLLEDDEEVDAMSPPFSDNSHGSKQEEEPDSAAEVVESQEPRIIRVTDMSLFIPLLSIADGVASSAGSQLISECIFSGTPILSLYRDNDDEQMLNVIMYQNLMANDKENDPTGIGKVVHGISLEEFSDAFSFLSVSGGGTQNDAFTSATREGTGASRLLTKEQEFLLLRKPEARKAYDEFDQFVDAIIRSDVSSTYYEEQIRGGASGDISGWHDPFQGMPDAAPVMLEILKEITGTGE